MNQFTDENSEELNMEQIVAGSLWGSAKLYDDVMSECDIDRDQNPEKWERTRSLLIEAARRHLEILIMANMDSQQKEHFSSLLQSAQRVDPGAESATILFRIASLYPELQDKVFESLQDFFDRFVANQTRE